MFVFLFVFTLSLYSFDLVGTQGETQRPNAGSTPGITQGAPQGNPMAQLMSQMMQQAMTQV